MAVSTLGVISLAMLMVTCFADEDLQRWSIQTKLDVPTTLKCEDSFNETQVSASNKLVWKKKDHSMAISSDLVYKLKSHGGMDDMLLEFTVTEETGGIYFCEVHDTKSTPNDVTDDKLVGVIVKGVNVGVREYDDFLDEYEENLIVGGIAGASVLFIIVAIGLLNHAQYRSEEQLEKDRYRKSEQMRRHNQNGFDNAAVTNDYPTTDQENSMKTSF